MGRQITIRSGPRTGKVIDVEDDDSTPTAPGGTMDGKQVSVNEAVDEMAGTPSNTGRTGQSTDAVNKYN